MTLHNGRHALVTGGGTGIGSAIAVALAKQGATVTVTGRRIETLEETCALAGGIHPLVMDVSDEGSIVNGTKDAIAARGPVDIMVANAGIAETASFAKMSLEFWRNTMTTNLDGPFLNIREVIPGMLEKGWGRVITIASIAGLRGLKYGGAYSTSKHGLIGLTRVVSSEYMGTGITANAICPGYVRTPIVTRNTEAIMKRSGLDRDQAEAAMTKDNPHKILVECAEVAEAALWICGANSGSINGQSIQIAGGHI